jgi:O-antigen/teichoic acid export membrane protein
VSTARKIFAYARRRASSDYHHSIVRRTVVLCGLVLPGFAANFFVYFFAAQLMSADQFGLLYVALTIGNVLYSGANILNAFLTRHLVRVSEISGRDAVVPEMLRLERQIVFIGAILSTLLFVSFLLASKQIGVQSPIIILLIALDTYLAYVGDLGRVLLQSVRKTMALGFYTTLWMILRLVMCVAGIVVFKTVWAALLGSVLSTAVVLAAFHIWIYSLAHPARPEPRATDLHLLNLLPAAVGYGLMVLVSNLDVLLAYFILNESDLGIYSASSVFPKAALVVVTPLLQMLIPAMVGADPSKRSFLFVAARIGGVILALTAAGSALVWLLSDQLCGSRFGLKLCTPPLLNILLISVVPLALLRTLVVIEFSRGRELLLLWLVVPAIAYALYMWTVPAGMSALAGRFAGFSIVAFVFFAGVCLLAHIGRRRSLSTGWFH